MKRKICSILDAGNWEIWVGAGEKGEKLIQRPTPPLPHPQQSVGKDFYRLMEGATCGTNIALIHLVVCHALV